MLIRVLRIGTIAVGLALLFHLSRAASLVRGNEEVPGVSWALGVLTVLFGVRALVTEATQGAAANLQKDLLWGLSAGGVLALLSQWVTSVPLSPSN